MLLKYMLLRQIALKTILASSFLISQNCMAESTCFGTTSNGRLEGGVALPLSGKNYVSYSNLSIMLNRTYLHSKVRDIVLDTYSVLEKKAPNKVYKYAETGHKNGGGFKPHKTHQNGLSIDFMVPVIDGKGKSVHLPTNPLNRYGYNIEFDENGFYDGHKIDFESMAAHIVELHKSSKKYGIDIWRVIFAPDLQKYLLKSKYGDYLKENITFNKKRSWVRHDEHYHVDFIVKCKKMINN